MVVVGTFRLRSAALEQKTIVATYCDALFGFLMLQFTVVFKTTVKIKFAVLSIGHIYLFREKFIILVYTVYTSL